MVTKIITRRIISSVKRSSAAEDSNRGDDEDNNKRNNTQGDNSNNDDKYHRNEGEENQHAKKLKGCQKKAADGGMICDNGHSYHDAFFRCKPNDDTTAEDDGKAVAFRQHTADTTCKKLPLLSDDADGTETKGGQRQRQKFNLTDVPPKLPILSNRKGASSKYQGVSFHTSNKWRAQIAIDGETHYIGTYANEDDAGIDYARAVFKYGVGKVNAPRKRGQQNAIDLTDVPAQPPILKSIGMGATSKYRGVCFHKATKKWRAQIEIDGKQQHIGCYANEEDAAVDYARVVFKYNKV